MKRDFIFFGFFVVSFILSLSISQQIQSAKAENVRPIAELPRKGERVLKGSPDSHSLAKTLSPRVSFEKTVFDLGDVGPGPKNECEFRFTNTGRDLLKIGKISRTCGCTVFQLDKKEYPPKRNKT